MRRHGRPWLGSHGAPSRNEVRRCPFVCLGPYGVLRSSIWSAWFSEASVCGTPGPEDGRHAMIDSTGEHVSYVCFSRSHTYLFHSSSTSSKCRLESTTASIANEPFEHRAGRPETPPLMDKTLCPFDPQRKTKPILLRPSVGSIRYRGGDKEGGAHRCYYLLGGKGGGATTTTTVPRSTDSFWDAR